ncbi:serine/threonine-protein kinase [Nocardioides solisilvae]|uniref:serine/threonine-protein kinase n=1 Tax=Nocardioides solisilvae TaxID=1542435 RepID=UPI000D74424D|nr:serine/threonine-protein kinase [Nocardioides solisilvae]
MTAAPRQQHGPAGRTAPGLRIGGYQLLTRLGEGGMGVVHLAARPGGPRVALKVLRPQVVGDDEARARLAREVETLSRVRSPRVAEVLDADPWGQVPFVVTRYVPGLSLQEHVRQEGPVRGDDLVHLAAALAEALAAVHAVGVLHRDVKPSNVLMEGRNPVLIDFGLARLADDPRITRVGWLMGTPGYLAPEILHGHDPTPASDVHSWAATVAWAATGRRPYGAGPDVAVMDRVRRGEHDLRGLDGPLRRVVLAALDPEPTARPKVAELRAWLRDGVPPGRPVPRPLPDEPRTLALPVPGTDDWDDDPTDDWRDDWRDAPTDDGRDDWQDAPTDDWSDEDDDEDEAWVPWTGDDRAPEPVPPMERLRRAVLLGGTATAAAAALAWAPWLAAATLVVLAWLLRSGSRAASAVRDRRLARGARWYDGVLASFSTPYHLLAAVPGTLLLGAWAAGVALAVGLLCFAFAVGESLSLGLVGAGFVLGLWAGPGSGRVRRPVGRVVRPVAARGVGWLVAAAVVGAVASGFVSLAAQGTHWDPASDAPWRAVPIPGLR